MNDIDPVLAHEHFIYDEVSGNLIWRTSTKHSPNRSGTIVGPKGRASSGYKVVKLNGVSYRQHRIIWAMHHGQMHGELIDHEDTDKTNNRIGNLRLANRSQNGANAKKSVKRRNPYKGAHWDSRAGKWTSRIKCGDRRYRLGMYDTPEEARDAYLEKAKELFGEYARVA